jgi:asparagine synthetase B (glutamine-hydrolysing)
MYKMTGLRSSSWQRPKKQETWMYRTLEDELLAAVTAGDAAAVRRLLEAGVDIHGYERDDYLGYDVNHMDAWGNTCLIHAREAGRPEMEALLVAYGAKE